MPIKDWVQRGPKGQVTEHLQVKDDVKAHHPQKGGASGDVEAEKAFGRMGQALRPGVSHPRTPVGYLDRIEGRARWKGKRKSKRAA